MGGLTRGEGRSNVLGLGRRVRYGALQPAPPVYQSPVVTGPPDRILEVWDPEWIPSRMIWDDRVSSPDSIVID